MKKTIFLIILFFLFPKIIYAEDLLAYFSICSDYNCKLEWSWDEINLNTPLSDLCNALGKTECWGYMGETSCDDKYIGGNIGGFRPGQMVSIPIKVEGCGVMWMGDLILKADETTRIHLDAFSDLPCCSGGCNVCNMSLCLAEALLEDKQNDLNALRSFRDEVLMQSDVGREYVKLYYKWSPAMILLIENDHALKEKLKDYLTTVIPAVKEGLKRKQSSR